MNNAPFKLAIVLPVYNTAQYLSTCLQSLAIQTSSDFVVFAIDDGSNDGSGDILGKFYKEHQWLKVLHKKNGGASSARNVALKLIESDPSLTYVGFVDSDDYVDKHYVERVLANLQLYQADYVTFACKPFDKKGFLDSKLLLPPFKILDQSGVSEHFCSKESIGHGMQDPTVRRWLATRVFKASAIRELRFETSQICGEDQAFFFKALPNLHRGILFPEYLYFYRLRKSSLSHSIKATEFELKIYEELYFNDTHFTENIRSHIERLLLNAWWQETRQAYLNHDEKSIQKVKRVYMAISSKQLQKTTSRENRRHLFMFRLGDWFLTRYFSAKNKRQSLSTNANFFD